METVLSTSKGPSTGPLTCLKAYRVGSANFSQRKIGHAHDNSADSENVAGAPQPNVRAHFIFRFENGSGNQSFFSIHNQNTAETSQPQAQPTDDWRAMDRACPRGLQRPLEKNLIQHGLVEKKKKQANFVNWRKLLLKGYKFKESKCDRFGKRPAATAAEKIDSTEADVSAFRRSIGLFFFFVYDRQRTLDLRFLLWMNLAKLLLERFRSSQEKAITFFAANLAEISLREELACESVIELLHRSCNWLK